MRILNPQPAIPDSHATSAADIEADFWRELQALETMHQQEMAELEAESIGWLPLGEGCYLHTGNDSAEILIVGTASASLAGHNVLWAC
jgi:hypothetical protein